MLVVADTSPINYLILVHQDALLPLFYTRVVIPTAVHGELQRPRTPLVVRAWVANPPPWFEVQQPQQHLEAGQFPKLGAGEREAIALVQVPIEKGQKNWQCGGRCFMTPARHLLGGDMQGRHSAIHIGMDDHTRATLTGWLRKQKTPVGLAKRARAMLLLADGYSFAATARQVELRERHVRKWALRFAVSGIDGLSDKKRPGRRPVFPPVVA